jgi:hypothetical protein
LLDDPAFERDDVTFCVWHCARGWEAGNPVFANGEDDGSSYLLGILYTTAKSYCEWAKAYYERAVSLSAVQAVYNGATITSSLVAELNPSRDPSQALAELAQQGLSE